MFSNSLTLMKGDKVVESLEIGADMLLFNFSFWIANCCVLHCSSGDRSHLYSLHKRQKLMVI